MHLNVDGLFFKKKNVDGLISIDPICNLCYECMVYHAFMVDRKNIGSKTVPFKFIFHQNLLFQNPCKDDSI